jgi:hypothetical protein
MHESNYTLEIVVPGIAQLLAMISPEQTFH